MAALTTPAEEFDQLLDLLTIDEENLPQEWHQQPLLYVKIARYNTRQHAAQAQAELNIKIIEANLDEIIRNRQSDKRVTERAIELEIHRHADWQLAQNARIDRVAVADLADACQRAAEMRERSLIRLSQRHLGGNLEDDERLLNIVNRIVREHAQRGTMQHNAHPLQRGATHV